MADDANAISGDTAIGHPRPLLRRPLWWSLDGRWDFAFDHRSTLEHPDEVRWETAINVPFAPETPFSGIGRTAYTEGCWYRRILRRPPLAAYERLLLHFGAVDHQATVWIDGELVARHEGGYTSFTVDVTRAVRDGVEHEIAVRALDDPLDLAKPRGKQDWELQPHSIWYHRTTGIWQTVWMERVGRTWIGEVSWQTSFEHLEVTADVNLCGVLDEDVQLRIRLQVGHRLLVDDTLAVVAGRPRIARGFRLDAGGLDQLREALAWSPERPTLVDAHLELRDVDDQLIDQAWSYTAIRAVGTAGGRFLLNGRPYPLRMVLDQGYWPQSGLTPPDDDALRRDIELTKAMGFNGVRKHQKIEDPRYLHWADRLGLLVWIEMPPAYQFDALAVRRVVDEWCQAVQRDRSHPCVAAWVPFNESTGVLALAQRTDQQHWVRALTPITRALDPTRPVVSNDGWETLGGDIIAVHDYEQDPERLVARWNEDLGELLTGFATHQRRQTLDEDETTWTGARPSRPIMLTEFGGIGWAPEAPVEREDEPPTEVPHDRIAQPAAWGYATVADVAELQTVFCALLDAVHGIRHLAGFCYTQLADTYQEINGLLTADREPKLPVDVVARAVRGTASDSRSRSPSHTAPGHRDGR